MHSDYDSKILFQTLNSTLFEIYLNVALPLNSPNSTKCHESGVRLNSLLQYILSTTVVNELPVKRINVLQWRQRVTCIQQCYLSSYIQNKNKLSNEKVND